MQRTPGFIDVFIPSTPPLPPVKYSRKRLLASLSRTRTSQNVPSHRSTTSVVVSPAAPAFHPSVWPTNPLLISSGASVTLTILKPNPPTLPIFVSARNVQATVCLVNREVVALRLLMLRTSWVMWKVTIIQRRLRPASGFHGFLRRIRSHQHNQSSARYHGQSKAK